MVTPTHNGWEIIKYNPERDKAKDVRKDDSKSRNDKVRPITKFTL